MFQKLDLFPSSGEGRETSTLLGPLESANLYSWTTHIEVEVVVNLPPLVQTRYKKESLS
jgi:hypothetical protein